MRIVFAGLALLALIGAPAAAQTIYLEGAALEATPIILTEPGATYVLMGDVTAPGTAIAFHGNADGTTLDLNGHTVTFGTEAGDMRYGIVSVMHYYRADRYPDVPQEIFVDGGSDNATIRGGSVVQGGGGGTMCAAVMMRGRSAHRVTGMTMRINGVDCRGIWGEYASGSTIDNNTIYNDSRWVENRHQGCAAIDFPNSGNAPHTIHHNTIIGGPQYGIRIGAGSDAAPTGWTEVYANNIYLDSTVSNAYSIGIYFPQMRVYDNVIEPVNGRGLHIGGDTSEVFNNTIDVICLGNSEYAELPSHGIKIERGRNSEIWGNHVVSRGRHDSGDIFVHPITGATRQVGALGDALNIDVETGGNNYIHDNTFIGIHEGGDEVGTNTHFAEYAVALNLFEIQPDHNTRIENNTFISNSLLFYSEYGDNGGVGGMLVQDCTFERDYTPADGHPFIPTAWHQHVNERTVVAFRDCTYGPGIDMREIEEGGGILDYTFTVEWTLAVTVRTDEGVPIPNAVVTASGGAYGPVTLNTDAAGAAPLVLREFAYIREGGVTEFSEYNPYTVTVSYAGAEGTQTVTMDDTRSLEFTLSGVTVDSPGQPGVVSLEPVSN